MALSNHERIGKALQHLAAGLAPFVEREFKAQYAGSWRKEVDAVLQDTRLGASKGDPLADPAVLLVLIDRRWGEVFRKTLGRAERSLVNELVQVRNDWAHNRNFSSDDADRGLDSIARLLTAVSAQEADAVAKMKMELRRVVFDEQMRTEKRKTAGTAIETQASGALKPWREVVTPHKDVASGNFRQAEFAADLWQVHEGEGGDEYRKPTEFFRRTFLTESLKRLLVGAASRLTSGGGDPVVQLQTNFGGGKTHSMLALYHLFSGTAPGEMPGVDAILAEAGIKTLPKAKRVVLVGNKISPGNPKTKPDGTVVRTLWGELAWQLGGKKAYKRIEADDERATSPGDALRELFNEAGPCLILIDEWVAYARQLHDQSDLPAGSFETQFTFAQALTESAKLAKNCLLVVSLPASEQQASPHVHADDAEVGGQRGREALDRLHHTIARVESSWRPANAEEGFEIVRRRLFEPLVDRQQFVARDTTAREFHNLYRTQHQEFPPECCESDYEKRLKAAYPIHPEIFDRLYTDWSTLVKFQRTRGVLRLMATVIHSLWEKGDRNPLIMPSNIPIDEPRVQHELTHYLSDNWVPVLEKDVDGPNSLPLMLDGQMTNLGKFQAHRRVARTIYLGSAPTATAANLGLEDRRVKLGCVVPGETPAVFGDALRHLARSATYLYQDGPRYWYSTQPTVTKVADDRAKQLERDPDKVAAEIAKRLKADLRRTGDFDRVHVLPQSPQDVPDDMDARLVVLGVEQVYGKEPDSPALAAAKAIWESKGSGPRIYRNTLVFLAPDRTRLQDLDEAVRRYLAWESILRDADAKQEPLELSTHQKGQAQTQKVAAENAVLARLPETYQWLVVPTQATPQSEIEWQAVRVSGQDSLAARVSKKLRTDGSLVASLAPVSLRHELDRIPLWRDDHVTVRQLAEDFARYVYLPRPRNPSVLVDCVREGPGLLTWDRDSFAYADDRDESTGRFRGLRAGEHVPMGGPDLVGVVVKPEVAARQLKADLEARRAEATAQGGAVAGGAREPIGSDTPPIEPHASSAKQMAKPRRFHGTVTLDPMRPGRDAGRIADEVIAHLTGIVGSKVRVSLEIEADIPEGASDQVVRTVTENCRTLKFTNQGFESE